MESQPLQTTVTRVMRITRDDTVQVREYCPLCGNTDSLYIVLAEVFCDGTKEHIRDWVELHEHSIVLRVYDYLRDEYGRVLGDLFDRDTGESLTQYLIGVGVAKQRPHHVTEVFENVLRHMEPGDAVG